MGRAHAYCPVTMFLFIFYILFYGLRGFSPRKPTQIEFIFYFNFFSVYVGFFMIGRVWPMLLFVGYKAHTSFGS